MSRDLEMSDQAYLKALHRLREHIEKMDMEEGRYDKLAGRLMPKGKCLWLRVGKLEVRFWFMWWKLSWKEKRKVIKSDLQSWMFGPWEFIKYHCRSNQEDVLEGA